jgi:isoleucyl-tRNA synthetase
MDRNDLRERTLHAIKQVKWMPSWGDERMSNMIAARPDWCISRQRVWGVPIIVFYCDTCRQPLTDRTILDRVVEEIAVHTADIWYSRSAAELIGENVHCSRCGHHEFRKETDILDVWFESGCSHLAVLTPENELPWPSNCYLEGGDQYRGWFHSSLLVGVALRGESPYRECATAGWLLDGEGRAMSKSLGNGIEPEDIIKQSGADVLRLWVASVDFIEDVRMSNTILARLTEAYRKFRNTFKFALGNLADFDPHTDPMPLDRMAEIDRWILVRTEDLVAKCRAWFDEFAFHKVYRALYDFAATDLSALYFDVAKDRLYTAATRSHARRSAQTALYRITYALVRLLAPILSFTMEEVWGYLAKPAGAPDSVHLALFPDPGELTGGLTLEQRARLANWDKLMPVREAVLRSLETARQEKIIGAPLEARVRLGANGPLYSLLNEYENELPGLFIVSQVELENSPEGELTIQVERATAEKCERCWKYLPDVGHDHSFPTVCLNCAAALKDNLGE